MKDITGFP